MRCDAFTPSTRREPGTKPEAPTITIELEQEGDTVGIRYRGNGSGLPEEWDMENAATLGRQIVHNLVVEQLGGSLEVTGDDGFEALIRFQGDSH